MKPRVPNRAKKWLRKAALWPAPSIPLFQRVVIELQAHCNRDCFFCCRESDTQGKRKNADGTSVLHAMPSEQVLNLFDQLSELGFGGYITFHHLSEAFLDKRLLTFAEEARRRGMKPYVHTNGDTLKNNPLMCRDAAKVFEYIVVGLYDYTSEEEKENEKAFWRERLRGTRVSFSLIEKAYVRTHSADNTQMQSLVRHTYPKGPCAEPQRYLLVHYNGDYCCCCEDMYGELLQANAFETPINEVWGAKRHVQVVDALRFGDRNKYELCRRCTMGPNGYSDDPLRDISHYDR